MSQILSLFDVADSVSLAGQRRYLQVKRLESWMLGIAAAMGVVWSVADAPAPAFVSGAAFITALAVRTLGRAAGAQAEWYRGRAAAESFKTLSWRYAVGGDPFPLRSRQDAESLLLERVADVTSLIDPEKVELRLDPEAITEWMRDVRSMPLEERREVYGRERIEGQRGWYHAKANWNSRRARMWGAALIAIEVLGALLAVGMATEVVGVDPLGLVAVVGVGVLTWIELKNHQMLAESYLLTASELDVIGSMIASQEDEDGWATFAADAEDAISREHTMWAASRRDHSSKDG